VLAALRATATPLPNSASEFGELDRLILIPTKRVQGFLHFYRKLPLFRECEDWQLLAYIAEGYRYVPILEQVRTAVFGREGMAKEPYTEYIPFSWTSANAMTNNYSCPQNSFVLMTISQINVSPFLSAYFFDFSSLVYSIRSTNFSIPWFEIMGRQLSLPFGTHWTKYSMLSTTTRILRISTVGMVLSLPWSDTFTNTSSLSSTILRSKMPPTTTSHI
jgi:hypothetical protein